MLQSQTPLTGRVPDLELDRLTLDFGLADLEIDTERRSVIVVGYVLGKPEKKT
jgi:hypothetical protein